MVALNDIRRQREHIRQLAARYGARDVRVFGSVARDEAAESSDLDLLVRMDEDRSLLDRISLQQALRDLLGIDVDVVNERALHPAVRERVVRDLVDL